MFQSKVTCSTADQCRIIVGNRFYPNLEFSNPSLISKFGKKYFIFVYFFTKSIHDIIFLLKFILFNLFQYKINLFI